MTGSPRPRSPAPVKVASKAASPGAGSTVAPPQVQAAQILLGLVAAGHLCVVADGTAIHAPLAVLSAFLAYELGTGRPWARRMTTLSQILSLTFGIVLWSSQGTHHAFVVLAGVAQALIVGMLWLPSASRGFFTRR